MIADAAEAALHFTNSVTSTFLTGANHSLLFYVGTHG
jgi:hypothetical protein